MKGKRLLKKVVRFDAFEWSGWIVRGRGGDGRQTNFETASVAVGGRRLRRF